MAIAARFPTSAAGHHHPQGSARPWEQQVHTVRSAAFGAGSPGMPRFGAGLMNATGSNTPCAAMRPHSYQVTPFSHAPPTNVMSQPWAARNFANMVMEPVPQQLSLTARPSKMPGAAHPSAQMMPTVPMFPPSGTGVSGMSERFVSWTTNHIQTTTAYSSYGNFVSVETSMRNQACAYSHYGGATTAASAVPTQASMSTVKAVETDVPDGGSAYGPTASGSAGTSGGNYLPMGTTSANASTVQDPPPDSRTPSTARTMLPPHMRSDQGAQHLQRSGQSPFNANTITPSSGTSRTLVPDGVANFFGWGSQQSRVDDAHSRMGQNNPRSELPACSAASAVLEFAHTIASTFTFGGSKNNNVAAPNPRINPAVTFNISPRTHARLQAGGQLSETEIVRIMRGVSSDGVSFQSETATSISTASTKWIGCMTAQTTESGGWFKCMPIASIRSMDSWRPKREKMDRRRRSCGCCK